MVVGNGLMAKAFSEMQSEADICVFASGVSDSESSLQAGFDRERNLLRSTIAAHPNALLVYFSTCSVEDPSVAHRPYCAHKLDMESLIATQAQRYLICRLSHIVGEGGNKNTIINYFVDKVRTGETFNLWAHAERNILEVTDVFAIVQSLIEAGIENKVVNVASPKSHSALEIVKTIEQHLGRTSNYTSLPKGAPLAIACPEMEVHFEELDRLKSPTYLLDILKKYHHV